jgi:WD40 repeat protein
MYIVCRSLSYPSMLYLIRDGIALMNALNGKLEKLFLSTNEGESISSFCMGSRHRKYFIGTYVGTVDLKNFRNGNTLGQGVKAKDIKKRESLAKSSISYQVSKICYCEDQNIVITGSHDSISRLYELDVDDFAPMREFKGGHNESEICTLEYSPNNLALYTGAINGTIAIWAVEVGRLAAVLQDSTNEITGIKDLYPYEALLASDTSGMIVCWDTKERIDAVSHTMKHPLLFKISGNLVGNMPQKVISLDNILMNNWTGKYENRFSRKSYEKTKSVQTWLASQDMVSTSYETHISMMAEYFKTDKGSLMNAVFKSETDIKEKRDSLITRVGLSRAPTLEIGLKPINKKSSLFTIMGFSGGTVNCLPIGFLLDHFNAKLTNTKEYNERRFDRFKQAIMRQETIDGSRIYGKYLKDIHAAVKSNSVMLVSLSSCSEFDTERELVSISTTQSPYSVVMTGSADGRVSFWSLDGDLHASVNMTTFEISKWSMPFDFVSIIENEVFRAIDMLEAVSGQQLDKATRDRLLRKYLYSNYMEPDIKCIQDRQREEDDSYKKKRKDYNEVEKKFANIKVEDTIAPTRIFSNFRQRKNSAPARPQSEMAKRLDKLMEASIQKSKSKHKVNFNERRRSSLFNHNANPMMIEIKNMASMALNVIGDNTTFKVSQQVYKIRPMSVGHAVKRYDTHD